MFGNLLVVLFYIALVIGLSLGLASGFMPALPRFKFRRKRRLVK